MVSTWRFIVLILVLAPANAWLSAFKPAGRSCPTKRFSIRMDATDIDADTTDSARSKFASLMPATPSSPKKGIPLQFLSFHKTALSTQIAVLPDDPCPTRVLPPKQQQQQRTLFYQPSLLCAQDVASIRDSISSAALMESDTKCMVAVDNGVVQSNRLAETLQPLLQGKILPWAQSTLKSPDLVVADALVRYYSDRENLPVHYDVTAFASAILPLNPAECQGGLYIQAVANETQYIHFEKSGDALLHRYDVMHGVQMEAGERYSLVIWFAESKEAMETKTVPWVIREAGSTVHASFLYATYAKDGLYGIEKDTVSAREHYEWAAKRGHALSQYCLAMLLFKQQQGNQAIHWLEKASSLGLASAQHQLGNIWKQGYWGVEQNHVKARYYYHLAANQGYSPAIEVLDDASRW